MGQVASCRLQPSAITTDYMSGASSGPASCTSLLETKGTPATEQRVLGWACVQGRILELVLRVVKPRPFERSNLPALYLFSSRSLALHLFVMQIRVSRLRQKKRAHRINSELSAASQAKPNGTNRTKPDVTIRSRATGQSRNVPAIVSTTGVECSCRGRDLLQL